MKNNYYFYDYKYWTLEAIKEMYHKLPFDSQKKLFRDALAHYSLAEILKTGDYDRRIIHLIWELAGEEVDKLNLIGTDCGRPLLGYERRYKSKLRKLINLTGELVIDDNDLRMTNFINGEWFLNNLVSLTIGSSFKKIIIDDMFLIDYNALNEEECLAIKDNFMRYMKGSALVFYETPKTLKK